MKKGTTSVEKRGTSHQNLVNVFDTKHIEQNTGKPRARQKKTCNMKEK